MKATLIHLGSVFSAMVWLLAASLAMGTASAATLYVDASVSQPGDGTTWQTAFKRIQEGIDAASDGDTIIVAEGTYVENIHFHGKNIILRSTNPLDSEVVATTIVDGSQSGSVATFDGMEDETCILSGFTIRNGQALMAAESTAPAVVPESRTTSSAATRPAGWAAGCLIATAPSRTT